MTKAVVMATWDDVPHLSPEDKANMLASYPAYQRDARSKGVPMLGAGAIYPIDDAQVEIEPFAIPAFWPRGYGLDVGWNVTAAIWGARDPEGGVLYLYDEYYGQQEKPAVHMDAISLRGDWMRGAIDPASRGRGQADGEQLFASYTDRERGGRLNLDLADNGVESGIYDCFQLMSAGRLRVFKTLAHWWQEKRLYRRDEKGKVVKVRDHTMDAMRYLIKTPKVLTLAPNYLQRMGMGKPRNVGEHDPYADRE